MMNLVKWDRKAGPILLQLALLHLTDRSQNRNSKQLFKLLGASEPKIQHLHGQCAADAKRESKNKRHHHNTLWVWKGLPPRLRRHDDPCFARPKGRMLFGNFCLL